MNIDEAIMYAIKTSHAIKDEKKEQLTDYFCQMQQENKKYKEVINKAINLLGNYIHYSVPDEKQNSYNEALVNKAYIILKKVEHEKSNN